MSPKIFDLKLDYEDVTDKFVKENVRSKPMTCKLLSLDFVLMSKGNNFITHIINLLLFNI